MVEQWKIKTKNYLYRNPFYQDGLWRCRRRYLRGEKKGHVESFAVEDPETRRPAHTRKHAQRIVAIIAASEEPGGECRGISLTDAVKAYLEEKGADLRPGTLVEYTSTLQKTALPELLALGAKAPNGVTREHVAKILTTGTAHERNWSARTRQKFLIAMRSFFEWCVASEYAERNPTSLFKAPKAWSEAIRNTRDRGIALSVEQARALLAACRRPFLKHIERHCGTSAGASYVQEYKSPPHIELFVMIGLRTGLRSGNITGLRVGHLKEDCTVIDIPPELMKHKRRLVVPVHKELQPLLREALKRIMEEKGRAPLPDDLVLGGVTIIHTLFDRVAKRAGLALVDGKKLRIHDLRHTFSTWLATRVPEAVKDALMGHSSSSISRRYVHLDIEDLREELDKLPWLEPRETGQEKHKAN